MSSCKAVKQEVAKQQSTQKLDGFSGFVEGVEGDDRPQGGSVIQGQLIKFDQYGRWVTADGDELSHDRELVAAGTIRIVQKWIDQKPVETIFVAPGEPFPDVKAMNEKAPRSEWRQDLNGNMVGPWQAQHVLSSSIRKRSTGSAIRRALPAAPSRFASCATKLNGCAPRVITPMRMPL